MKARMPPFITPFAILSIILLLGTTNVVENHVTHTQEGGSVRTAPQVNNSRPVNSPNQSTTDQTNRSSSSSTSQNSGSNGKSNPSIASNKRASRSQLRTGSSTQSSKSDSQVRTGLPDHQATNKAPVDRK